MVLLAVMTTAGLVGYYVNRDPESEDKPGGLFRRAASMQPLVTSESDDFVHGIGINQHIDQEDYYNRYDSIIKPRTRELGVRLIRQGFTTFCNPGTNCAFGAFIERLHGLNEPPMSGRPPIRLLYQTYYNENNYDSMWPTHPCWLPKLKTVMQGGTIPCGPETGTPVPGSMEVEAVEARNEMDHCPSYNTSCQSVPGTWYDKSLAHIPNWPSLVIQKTQETKAALASDPVTSGLKVVGPSFVHVNEFATTSAGNGQTVGELVAPVLQSSDYANNHPYCDINGLYYCMRPGASDGFSAWESYFGPSRPLWTTETGYSKYPRNELTPVVSDTMHAKYIGRALLDMFDRGIQRYIWYELLDRGEATSPNLRDAHYGLVREDGSVKPAFTALKNLITLLSDYGPSFTPTTLYADISAPSALHVTAFQKRNGEYWVALRNEVNTSTDSDQTISATLKFEGSFARAETYKPRTGTGALATYTNPGTLTLTIPDDTLLLRLVPASGGGTTGSSTTSSTGSGGTTSSTGSGGTTSGTGSGTQGRPGGTTSSTVTGPTSSDTSGDTASTTSSDTSGDTGSGPTESGPIESGTTDSLADNDNPLILELPQIERRGVLAVGWAMLAGSLVEILYFARKVLLHLPR